MGPPEPTKCPKYKAESPSQRGAGPRSRFQSTHLKGGPPSPLSLVPPLSSLALQPLRFPSPDRFPSAVVGGGGRQGLRGSGIRGVFSMLGFFGIKEFLCLIGFTLSHGRVGPSFPQQQLETALNMIN